MKKAICFLSVLLIILSLSACVDDTATVDTNNTTVSQTEQTTSTTESTTTTSKPTSTTTQTTERTTTTITTTTTTTITKATTSTKSETTVTPPQESSSQTVYITKTGKKYHCTKNCPGLSTAKEIFESTLTEALNKNLGPCSKCY